MFNINIYPDSGWGPLGGHHVKALSGGVVQSELYEFLLHIQGPNP